MIHEPIEIQREEVIRRCSNMPSHIRDVLVNQTLNGLDCDQLPLGRGKFGSMDNPIPVNGPIGEIKYLIKLKGTNGLATMFHRIGSCRSEVALHPLDLFEVVCIDGSQWAHLYFDSYHPRRSNLCPDGFYLEPLNKLRGIDSNSGLGTTYFVENFPHLLPEAILHQYGTQQGRLPAEIVSTFIKANTFNRPPELEGTTHLLSRQTINRETVL